MTNGGVDRSVECTGNIQAMISAFECVHDVCFQPTNLSTSTNKINKVQISFGLYTDRFTPYGFDPFQGWGVAVLVGVPNKDDAFKTHPVNFLNERTLKGTFFGNYKPRTDIPGVVEKYMNKVTKELCVLFSNDL